MSLSNTGLWPVLSQLALLHGRRIAARDLEAQSAHLGQADIYAVAGKTLQEHGFRVKVLTIPLHELPRNKPPILLVLKGGEAVILLSLEGETAVLWHACEGENGVDGGQTETLPISKLHDGYAGTAILVALEQISEGELGDGKSSAPSNNWFWSVFTQLRQYYGDCAVAAILVNLLALAASMFAMNVYDRVIPNGALHTLWVLAIGVLIAGFLEFFLRTLRARVVDQAGKRADLQLSAAVFRQSLGLMPKDRPTSSGQFASHLREFESVREFVSSTTLVGLTDLPFAILFLLVIGFLGGGIVWVPIVGASLVLLAGLISQWPIRRSIEQYQYESAQKFAYSVEAFERLETIQALGAFSVVQGRWERLCAVAARSSMDSRMVSAATLNLTQYIQQITGTALILIGVYQILDNQLTTGGLIGCSILASRALAPMAQIAGLMTRWQQARVAFLALDKIMQIPNQYDPSRTYLHIHRAHGEWELKDLSFTYPRSEKRALSIERLSFKAGEAVAVMGSIGSGKSTLLKILAGLQQSTEGLLLLDGIDIRQLSPSDFRSQIAWVGQDSVLFRGSLRENLLLGTPTVSEAHFLHVLEMTGVLHLANNHPHGLDMQLGEGGQALSGGQRQMVALARSLLSDAPVILLDEPTSAFDGSSEQQIITSLKSALAGRTLILATHRPGPLDLVSRIVILDNGRVVADGPRDAVLRAVKDGKVMRSQRSSEVECLSAGKENLA